MYYPCSYAKFFTNNTHINAQAAPDKIHDANILLFFYICNTRVQIFDAKLTKIYAKSIKSTECVQIASIFPHLPTKRPAEGFRGFKLQKLIIRKFFVIIRKKVHVRIAYVKKIL